MSVRAFSFGATKLSPIIGLRKTCRVQDFQRKLTFTPRRVPVLMTATTPIAAPSIVGPEWDNSKEYLNLEAPELKSDLAYVEKLISELTAACSSVDLSKLENVDVSLLASVTQKATEASTLLSNVGTFASCESSVDGSNTQALSVSATVRTLFAKMTQAVQPVSLALKLAPDSVIEKYLALVPEETFNVHHQRKVKDQTLSLAEENLLTALSVDGHQAWAQMYSSISSTLTVKVGEETMGIAKAAALLASPDSTTRLRAWQGIQNAWRQHEEAAAAVINSIVGWRIEVNRRRGAQAGRPIHYLETALHQNRMSMKTLEAMMKAVKDVEPMAQKALKLQAKALGKTQLHPADLMAPPPARAAETAGELSVSFDEGLGIVAGAVSGVDVSLGDFVRMMAEKGWIEGRAGDKKKPGAYCTEFSKSRTPRVYLSSYTGSFQHVTTLAHELGHAYHTWVMRDMPTAQRRYPMNLAETASLFYETVVADRLVGLAGTAEEKLKYSWYDADAAASFLLNIPARFDFDSAVHEAREQGRSLTPPRLREMMAQAWRGRYGDALSEVDEMFWASKLHFHLTNPQFYNFPYTFGYLFALGVYAQQEAKGAEFHEAYVALLRDTGRMTAEEVVQKHLGVSIEEPEFWAGSARIVARKVDAFEQHLRAAGFI